MEPIIDLEGKTILVAGASSGIGKQIALRLAECGARIAIVARREQKLIETLEQASGSGHQYYVLDLSDTSRIGSLVQRVVGEMGKLDGMVYSAGIATDRPLKMCTPDMLETMFKINFFGFYEMVRNVTLRGNYNPGMSVVGISSSAANRGQKSQSMYTATKAAMDASVQVISHELANKGIRVNTIRPGMVRTEMWERFQENYGEEGEKLIRKTQFLGVGDPLDIANAAAYLLSDAAKFITGIHFSVDGGASACK